MPKKPIILFSNSQIWPYNAQKSPCCAQNCPYNAQGIGIILIKSLHISIQKKLCNQLLYSSNLRLAAVAQQHASMYTIYVVINNCAFCTILDHKQDWLSACNHTSLSNSFVIGDKEVLKLTKLCALPITAYSVRHAHAFNCGVNH